MCDLLKVTDPEKLKKTLEKEAPNVEQPSLNNINIPVLNAPSIS